MNLFASTSECDSNLKHIKYFTHTNPLQTKLKNDLNQLKGLKKVVVFADKSSNLYCLSPQDYHQKIKDSITSDYRKVEVSKVEECNLKMANIAKSLELEDQMEGIVPSNCFMTIKDQKSDFPTNIHVRVIAPSKADVGKASKVILQKIVLELNNILNLNQWRDPAEVTNWFKGIKLKRKATFLKFDVVSFYPSIKKELFEKAIKFAKSYVFINDQDVKTIYSARQSFLYHKDEPWVKVGSEDFDIPMGSNDSAECCELIGMYLLHSITQKSKDILPRFL